MAASFCLYPSLTTPLQLPPLLRLPNTPSLPPPFHFRHCLPFHHRIPAGPATRSVHSDSLDNAPASQDDDGFRVGTPVVIVEAPPFLKTAEPMPMLRPNTGLIKPGDAGRIISRKPKNVWAVRFVVGAYLIDRKYFKPLDWN